MSFLSAATLTKPPGIMLYEFSLAIAKVLQTTFLGSKCSLVRFGAVEKDIFSCATKRYGFAKICFFKSAISASFKNSQK